MSTTATARGARVLTIASLVVGVVNYAFSLVLTHVLPIAQFAVVGAGQALLLTAGTVASTSVSWVLAQALLEARSRADRRAALWFSVCTNLVLGAAGGLVTYLLGTRFASGPACLVLAAGVFLVFCSATGVGLLQGEERLGLLGAGRIGEVLAKVVVGLVLVVAGAGAAGALGGFLAGSLLLVAVGVVVARGDLRPVRGVLRLRRLWAPAVGVVGVQGLVAVLTSTDLVLVAVLADDAAQASTYQAAVIVSRVPLFVATALSASVFAVVVRDPAGSARVLRRTSVAYALLCAPYAAALTVAPSSLLGVVLPAGYALSGVLPWTSAAGLVLGWVVLLATHVQARALYRRSVLAQTAALAGHVVALVAGYLLGGVPGLAAGALAGFVLTALALFLAVPRTWRPAFALPLPVLAGSVLLAAALLPLRPHPVAWVLLALVVGAGLALLGLRAVGAPTAAPDVTDPARRLRILHLGFEDPRKPGSGGGAVRTREIDERLARDHDVTVLVSSYPGAVERVENGVRWVPVGLPLGYFGGIVSYFLAVPFALRRYEADLVVEDFGAPVGSFLPQLWTTTPVVAVVQWLGAEEKARQYHLPFHWVQNLGVRRHRTLIAMSEDLGDRLRDMNPAAEVVVLPNGVVRDAFDARGVRGDDVVFLGRLEVEQKGLDLLLPAFAAVADRLPGRLVVAGDGAGRPAVAALAASLGIADRVVFAGRVEGEAKYALLATALLVAMPSRQETFGIVAAESLACGTPVVAFEIPSLREVVVPGTGVLVPAFDVDAYGEALAALAGDPATVEAMGRAGRDHARGYDWDDVARRQDDLYRRLATVRAGA
ncbi:glycosyltransferase [Kineococcus aurantiacus]|uniref:Glycosyltransferase involved in cell wall biosynthesis n=1 Tax=Kineococcus aurantiacus TaxID=37633 RepID=A0A7Y9J253_9ACTN|nr:glycosyltransferase involved in cell wall biosynthesis [Kineococcus aurantiacus]